jgi:hypothetical protein
MGFQYFGHGPLERQSGETKSEWAYRLKAAGVIQYDEPVVDEPPRKAAKKLSKFIARLTAPGVQYGDDDPVTSLGNSSDPKELRKALKKAKKLRKRLRKALKALGDPSPNSPSGGDARDSANRPSGGSAS